VSRPGSGLLVAVALAGVMAACGGPTRLSKADFVRRGNAICQRMSNDLDTALRGFTQNPTDPNTPDDVVRREGRALVNAEPTVRTHLSELNKLHPPSDARHDWGRYLDQLDTAVKRYAALSGRLAGGDRHAATELDSLSEITATGDAWARTYGLHVCGQT